MCNRNKIDFSWGPCKAGKIVNETGSMHRAKNTVIEFKAIQGVLALCEFHYCNFSKNSINLPYANFGLFYFITLPFWAEIFALCKIWAILFH